MQDKEIKYMHLKSFNRLLESTISLPFRTLNMFSSNEVLPVMQENIKLWIDRESSTRVTYNIHLGYGKHSWTIQKNLAKILSLNTVLYYNGIRNLYDNLLDLYPEQIYEKIEHFLRSILYKSRFKDLEDIYHFFNISKFSFLGSRDYEERLYVSIHSVVENWSCIRSCIGRSPEKFNKMVIICKPSFMIFLTTGFKLERMIFLNKGTSITIKKHALYSKLQIIDNTQALVVKSFTHSKIERLYTKLSNYLAAYCKNTRYGSFSPIRFDTVVNYYVDACSYFDNLFETLLLARSEIFIAGWWVYPTLYLKRKIKHGKLDKKYRLDKVLRTKAKQGVKISILIYREVEIALPINSKHTVDKLGNLHRNITVLRHPNIRQSGLIYWTHHEKIVVIDQKIAFIGGIDLCLGRFDTSKHLLFDALNNSNVRVKVRGENRRMSVFSESIKSELREEAAYSTDSHADKVDSMLDVKAVSCESFEAGRQLIFDRAFSETEVEILSNRKLRDKKKFCRMLLKKTCISDSHKQEYLNNCQSDLSTELEGDWLNFSTNESQIRSRVNENSSVAPKVSDDIQEGAEHEEESSKSSLKTVENRDVITVYEDCDSGASSGICENKQVGGKYGSNITKSQAFLSVIRESAQVSQSTGQNENHTYNKEPRFKLESELVSGENTETHETNHSLAEHDVLLDGVLWPGKDYSNPLKKDFINVENADKTLIDRSKEPRMPWHDLQCKLVGSSASDVAKHFIQRWNMVCDLEGFSSKVLIPIDYIQGKSTDSSTTCSSKCDDATEESRSEPSFGNGGTNLENNQALGTKKEMQTFPSDFINSSESATKMNRSEEECDVSVNQTPMAESRDQVKTQIVRSVGQWSLNVQTENSIEKAYENLIMEAKKYIYIENQFFVTNCQKNSKEFPINTLGYTLLNRIKLAHKNNEDFKVYVLIPLLPAFESNFATSHSSTIKKVIALQSKSINQGKKSLCENLRTKNINPDKYITFLSLQKVSFDAGLIFHEQIYIHSKIMIVDGTRAIIGSANFNDRSMLGSRDSEIAVVIDDPSGKSVVALLKKLLVEHMEIKYKPKANLRNPETPEENLRSKLEATFRNNSWSKLESDLMFNLIKNIATVNTQTFRELFRSIPDNEVKTTSDYLAFKAVPALAEHAVNSQTILSIVKRIKGRMVLYPYEFLTDEEEKNDIFTIQGLIPSSVFY